MEEKAFEPKQIETQIVARCVHCGNDLFIETYVEEKREEGLEIIGHSASSKNVPRCPCRS